VLLPLMGDGVLDMLEGKLPGYWVMRDVPFHGDPKLVAQVSRRAGRRSSRSAQRWCCWRVAIWTGATTRFLLSRWMAGNCGAIAGRTASCGPGSIRRRTEAALPTSRLR